LDNGSSFTSNTLYNGSVFTLNTLDNGSVFASNTLDNSIFDFSPSGTLSSKNILQINAKNCIVNFDISSAIDIYFDCSKTIFKNNAQVSRLSYYDATDTLIITDVDN
jgi:hypothetical protein